MSVHFHFSISHLFPIKNVYLIMGIFVNSPNFVVVMLEVLLPKSFFRMVSSPKVIDSGEYIEGR